jgi:hypothetical protein
LGACAALAPDPHRRDVLTWVTSYQGLYTQPGIPIVDLFNIGKAGTDPRMLFSWYSGSFTTDPDFADLPTPEERANPTMSSWVDGAKYLEQQKRRLPSSRAKEFGKLSRLAQRADSSGPSGHLMKKTH